MANHNNYAQRLAECQNAIKNLSHSDWMGEKLLKGVKMHKEHLLQCEQDIHALDAQIGQQQAELGKCVSPGTVS